MSAKKDERTRDIRVMWERDANGPILRRDHAPPGLRTSNGHVWGHQLDHLFWIQRIPGAQALTVWSRSMVKELGEGYNDSEWDEPLVEPRVVRPWPVLKLRRADGEGGEGKGQDDDGETLNKPDRGCAHEHGLTKPIAPPPGWKRDPDAVMAPEVLAILGECPFDPEEECTGPMLANVGPERKTNAEGEPYDYVWCEHMKEMLGSVSDPTPFFAQAIGKTGHYHIVPDSTGMIYYAPPDAPDDVAAASDETKEDNAPAASAGGVSENAPTTVGGTADADGDVAMADAAPSAEDAEDAKNASSVDDNTPEHTGKTKGKGKNKKKGKKSKGKKKDKGKEKATSVTSNDESNDESDLFSVEGLPKLEEFIPTEFFPDVLMVHDPDNVTYSKRSDQGKDKKPITYKRWYPSLPTDSGTDKGENVAHLYLSRANRFGSGNHSFVYRAPLTLPPPLSARSRTGQVTVAAKLAYSRCTAHGLLHNEARVYDCLPRHTQEEWCGYNVVAQCRYPVPVTAIAPKFFGYYMPVNADGDPVKREHGKCSEEKPCGVDWPSPILLMEECGEPVKPHKFTPDQRTECFSLLLRLHHLDIVQGSFYVRNIMSQPGPLSAPPEERSYDTPSFRIIDFGRGRSWEWDMDGPGDVEKLRTEFGQMIGDEISRARSELLITDLGY